MKKMKDYMEKGKEVMNDILTLFAFINLILDFIEYIMNFRHFPRPTIVVYNGRHAH